MCGIDGVLDSILHLLTTYVVYIHDS
jgi:hypothetical protein